MTPQNLAHPKIIQLSQRLHWIRIDEDGVPEFIIDNHMLQTFRMCEARFWHEFVEGRSRQSGGSLWFLDFGTAVHKAIEIYYLRRTQRNFDLVSWTKTTCSKIWNHLEMDQKYAAHKDYQTLGGFTGFAVLMFQYAQYFNLQNERFRIIGAELYFGKNKEVPIYENYLEIPNFPARVYLSGKIDLLVDDGYGIGPMDHKTKKDFQGKNPNDGYLVHEGMCGYIYAGQKLLKNFDVGNRLCNKIWMNHLQVKSDPDPSKRFRRMPVFKTDWQLEQYRQRQISTVKRIYDLIINSDVLSPNFNTMACDNYMRHECGFKVAHRQNTPEDMLKILDSEFPVGKVWDPEEREGDDIDEIIKTTTIA